LPARFGPAVAAVASPSPSPTEALTAAPTATGEVKGAQTGGGEAQGVSWLMLLIPPIVSVVSLPFLGAGGFRNLGLPIIGTTGTYVLSYYVPGHNISRNLFLWILAAELIIIVVINILLFREAEEIAEEILEEAEGKLNKKPRKR
jgi:hypothetical protein